MFSFLLFILTIIKRRKLRKSWNGLDGTTRRAAARKNPEWVLLLYDELLEFNYFDTCQILSVLWISIFFHGLIGTGVVLTYQSALFLQKQVAVRCILRYKRARFVVLMNFYQSVNNPIVILTICMLNMEKVDDNISLQTRLKINLFLSGRTPNWIRKNETFEPHLLSSR